MEYVLFAFMMIVPVISIAAFVISLLNAKKIKTIKKLVTDILKTSARSDEVINSAIGEYLVESI